jgi:hypothetical protein
MWFRPELPCQELVIELDEIARIRAQVDGLGDAIRSPGVCK